LLRFEKIYFLCISLVLYGGCLGYAATTVWTNGSGNRDWSTAINWTPRVPQSVDTAVINSGVESPIIHNGVKAANIVKIGDAGTEEASLYINADAILNIGSSCSIGCGTEGIININGGFLDIVLGDSDTYGYLIVGGSNGGNGVVEMTDGMIQTWDMMVGYYSGNGIVNLMGGIIDIAKPGGVPDITTRGLVNIKAGSLLLDGDQTVTCSNYIHSEKIIAYDGNGTVLVDYNNVNPGKTTVWAVGPELPTDFTGDNIVNAYDLKYLADTWLEHDLQVRPIGDIDGNFGVDLFDMSMFAKDWSSKKKLDFLLFIGPNDCPGATQFADPYVLKQDGAFYITSTYTVGLPMYMFCTTDFTNKKRYTLNLDLNESYLRTYFADPFLTAYHVWGFVPYKHADDSWHAYATVHIGGYKTFVCHFSPDGGSTWPITDWKLDKVLVGSPSNIAYESKVYSDAGGMYLLYVDTLGDGNNHIVAQKMLDPDDLDTSFTARVILSPEGLASEYRNPPGGMQICEGTNISHIVTSSGSKYVMFYSVGDFAESNYKLGVAYSDVLIPPIGHRYEKPKSYDSLNVWGNPGPRNEVVYTLQTQVAEWPNYYETLFNGPGLGNLVEYLGNYYAIFHARYPGQTGTGDGRWVWMCPVTIDFTESMDSWLVPQLP